VSVLAALQVDSVVSSLIALVIPALDAIVPVLPSETAVIALDRHQRRDRGHPPRAPPPARPRPVTASHRRG
jgi:hypothetical protein